MASQSRVNYLPNRLNHSIRIPVAYFLLHPRKPLQNTKIKQFMSAARGAESTESVLKYAKLENSPKKARALIGLKSCLYNSMETELARAVDVVMT